MILLRFWILTCVQIEQGVCVNMEFKLLIEQILSNHAIAYQFSFLVDDFYNVSILCASNNAGS